MGSFATFHWLRYGLQRLQKHKDPTFWFKGIPETVVCGILMFMWSFGPLFIQKLLGSSSQRPSATEGPSEEDKAKGILRNDRPAYCRSRLGNWRIIQVLWPAATNKNWFIRLPKSSDHCPSQSYGPNIDAHARTTWSKLKLPCSNLRAIARQWRSLLLLTKDPAGRRSLMAPCLALFNFGTAVHGRFGGVQLRARHSCEVLVLA